MNINKFIENLQNKPRIIRIQILIGAVFVSMVFITWVWLVSLNLSSPLHPAQNEGGAGQATERSAFEQLKEVGEDTFKSLEDLKRSFPAPEETKGLIQEKIEPVRLPLEQTWK